MLWAAPGVVPLLLDGARFRNGQVRVKKQLVWLQQALVVSG